MEVRFYHDPAEKRTLKQSAHSRGMQTIHDDFLDEGNHATNGDIGKLTFDFSPPDPPPRVIKTLDELNLLLFKKEIEYIELLDLLTIQALSLTRWQRFRAMFSP